MIQCNQTARKDHRKIKHSLSYMKIAELNCCLYERPILRFGHPNNPVFTVDIKPTSTISGFEDALFC